MIVGALTGAIAGGVVDYLRQRQREKKALFITVRRISYPSISQGAAYLRGTVTNIGERSVILEKVEMRGYRVNKRFSENSGLSFQKDSVDGNQYTLGQRLEPGKGFAYTLTTKKVEQELFDQGTGNVVVTVIFKSFRPNMRYTSDPVELEPTDYNQDNG